MKLREAILDWIAKRDAAIRDPDGDGGLRRSSHRPADARAAYADAERRLGEAVAELSPFAATPLGEAARLWYAAKKMAGFTQHVARHGTGPCPEILHALRAAEAVLHVLATGRPGLNPDDAPATSHPHRADEAAFEFAAANTDLWVVRDCEEEAGCTVVERFHRQEVAAAAAEDRDPEPVQVIDVPPDLCTLVGRALASRAERVVGQRRKAGPG